MRERIKRDKLNKRKVMPNSKETYRTQLTTELLRITFAIMFKWKKFSR